MGGTVDADFGTADEAAVVGDEHGDDTGDIFGTCQLFRVVLRDNGDQAAEKRPVGVPIIAARTGRSLNDLDVALAAAMANTAVRLGTERWAAEAGPDSAADVVDTCLARLAAHTLL